MKYYSGTHYTLQIYTMFHSFWVLPTTLNFLWHTRREDNIKMDLRKIGCENVNSLRIVSNGWLQYSSVETSGYITTTD